MAEELKDAQGYKLNWEDNSGDIPKYRISMFSNVWKLFAGNHPNTFLTPFVDIDYFADIKNNKISTDYQIRPMGCVHGHNIMRDENIVHYTAADTNVPISPILAKDLTGRIIHIGSMSEVKEFAHWNLYGFNNDKVPNIAFPHGCMYVDDSVEGVKFLENIFFTKFRALEFSIDEIAYSSGNNETRFECKYENANLYPYKLRLDTFYVDGWKIPQTQMVYAKQDVNKFDSEAEGLKLMEKWRDRPEGQTYEQFYDAVGGDEYFEKLFNKGCTLIPTFEACNGVNKVSRNFDLEGYWPGRAVEGLHVIKKAIHSDAPANTILEVLKPGFVLGHKIEPAEVIVSDGGGYVSPNSSHDPKAMLPDLRLPHQRTVANWGATWVPTHPAHFEEPALFGWDAVTGRFLQLFGPIWDPLHYYYNCTNKVLKAFENRMEENKWLAPVPEEMKLKFHPVVPMEGFDTISEPKLLEDIVAQNLPQTSIKHIDTGTQACNAGYHPMPLQFEYELDTWWFPELAPMNRTPEMPENIEGLLAPVITSAVMPRMYAETVEVPEYLGELKKDKSYRAPTADKMINYPYLIRYLKPDCSVEEMMEHSVVFLKHQPAEFVKMPVQELWGGPFGDMDKEEELEKIAKGFYNAAYEMKEEARELNIFRHSLYRNDIETYTIAWWKCIPLATVAQFLKERSGAVKKQRQPSENKDKNKQPPKFMQGAIMGAPIIKK